MLHGMFDSRFHFHSQHKRKHFSHAWAWAYLAHVPQDTQNFIHLTLDSMFKVAKEYD